MSAQGDAPQVESRKGAASRLVKKLRTVDRSVLAATVVVAYVFGAALTWATLTPMGAAPDEPAHIAYAAAVVRGDIGDPITGEAKTPQRLSTVTAPEWVTTFTSPPRSLDDFNYPCFATIVARSADCAPSLSLSTALGEVPTTVGRYPPLFHAIVGIPTLALAGTRAVYVMRIFAAILAAGSIALGLAIASPERRTWLALAAAVAFTPTAAHLAGSVNPSGFEIASALGLGIALMGVTASGRHQWWTLPALTTLTIALAWSRPLGYLTLAAVITASAIINWQELRAWIRAAALPRLILAAPVVAAVTAIAYRIVWGLPVRAASAAGPDTGSTLFSSIGLGTGIDEVEQHLIRWSLDFVGRFGWSDHAAPGSVLLWWTLVVLTLAFFVLLGADRRDRIALSAIGVTALVLAPLLAITRFINASAYEARYHLPLAVVIVVVLTAVALRLRPSDERRIAGSILAWGAALAPLAMLASVAASFHRYVLGAEAQLADLPDLMRGGTKWLPPREALAAASIGVIILLAATVYGFVSVRRGTESDETVDARP